VAQPGEVYEGAPVAHVGGVFGHVSHGVGVDGGNVGAPSRSVFIQRCSPLGKTTRAR
jgi:hypothetical protein